MASAPVHAQMGGLPIGDRPGVHLTVVKPFLTQSRFDVAIADNPGSWTAADSEEFGPATGMLRADVTIPIGTTTAGFVGFGLSHTTWRRAGSTASPSRSVALWAPRLGLVHRPEGAQTEWEAHVTLPSVTVHGNDGLALEVAEWSGPERTGHHQPDVLSAAVSVAPARALSDGSAVGFLAGFTVVVEPGADRSKTDTNVRYGLFGSRPLGGVIVRAQLSGTGFLTQQLPSRLYDPRADHEIVLAFQRGVAGGAPRLYLWIPLDDDVRDHVNVALGLRVTM